MKGFLSRAACKCLLTSKNFPKSDVSFGECKFHMYKIYSGGKKSDTHLAVVVHVVHFFNVSLKFLRHFKSTYIRFQFGFC